jgi:hypothetical protein
MSPRPKASWKPTTPHWNIEYWITVKFYPSIGAGIIYCETNCLKSAEKFQDVLQVVTHLVAKTTQKTVSSALSRHRRPLPPPRPPRALQRATKVAGVRFSPGHVVAVRPVRWKHSVHRATTSQQLNIKFSLFFQEYRSTHWRKS